MVRGIRKNDTSDSDDPGRAPMAIEKVTLSKRHDPPPSRRVRSLAKMNNCLKAIIVGNLINRNMDGEKLQSKHDHYCVPWSWVDLRLHHAGEVSLGHAMCAT